MRNNTRIHSITNRVGDLWFTKVPDWRFGQLMSNFFSSIQPDPFYIEDEDLVQRLEQYLEGYKTRQ